MSNYTENFSSTSGDTVDSAELETEFDAIAAAIATKLDSDGSGTMTGALNMGSNKITSLTDPTANQDAATRASVNNAEVANFESPGTSVITTSEVLEDTVSVTIPSDWNTYDVEIIGALILSETTTLAANTNITMRVRTGSGTGGTALATYQQSMYATSSFQNLDTVPIYAYQTGETTTGSVTWSLTSEATAESGKVSMANCNWRVRARRTS